MQCIANALLIHHAATVINHRRQLHRFTLSTFDTIITQTPPRLQHHHIAERNAGEGLTDFILPIFQQTQWRHHQNRLLRLVSRALTGQILPDCDQRHVCLAEAHVICKQTTLQAIEIIRFILQRCAHQLQHPLDPLTLMRERLPGIGRPIRHHQRRRSSSLTQQRRINLVGILENDPDFLLVLPRENTLLAVRLAIAHISHVLASPGQLLLNSRRVRDVDYLTRERQTRRTLFISRLQYLLEALQIVRRLNQFAQNRYRCRTFIQRKPVILGCVQHTEIHVLKLANTRNPGREAHLQIDQRSIEKRRWRGNKLVDLISRDTFVSQHIADAIHPRLIQQQQTIVDAQHTTIGGHIQLRPAFFQLVNTGAIPKARAELEAAVW